MPLFLCRWPSGDFSVVNADDEEEAIERLDDVGDAADPAAIVVEFPDFMMHFRLPEKMAEADDLDAMLPPLTIETFGDRTEDFLSQEFYPKFREAARNIDFDADPGTSEEQAVEALNKALAEEKARLWIERPIGSSHPGPKLVM